MNPRMHTHPPQSFDKNKKKRENIHPFGTTQALFFFFFTRHDAIVVRPPLGTYLTLCHSCCPGPWHSDVHAQLHLHCLNGFYQASDSHTDQGRVGVLIGIK